MNIQRIANGLTFILLFLCAVLIVIIVRQWSGMTVDNVLVETNENSTNNNNNETGMLNFIDQTNVNISQFMEILNRPLFVQGRLPYEGEQTEKDMTSNAAPLKLRLEGVVISPEARVAVVRDLTNNTLMRLGVGMIHNGWRVNKVEKQSVDFERGDEVQSIQLELVSEPIEKAKKSGFKLPKKPKRKASNTRR